MPQDENKTQDIQQHNTPTKPAVVENPPEPLKQIDDTKNLISSNEEKSQTTNEEVKAEISEELKGEEISAPQTEMIESKSEQGIVKEEPTTEPQQPQIKTVEKIVYKTDPNFIQKLLIKARARIQERKRKKLDRIMGLFDTNPQITNKDVQKLLRTTKRTARRYFDQLEQEQKITQIGKVGRSVLYTKKL